MLWAVAHKNDLDSICIQRIHFALDGLLWHLGSKSSISRNQRAASRLLQELQRHEGLASSWEAGVLVKAGFATPAERRRQEARIRVLLGRRMAERGQGFRADVTGDAVACISRPGGRSTTRAPASWAAVIPANLVTKGSSRFVTESSSLSA